MQALKLVAVDLDGPLLLDTFAPLLYQSCRHYGWDYTREFERNTLSRPRLQVVQYFRDRFADNPPDDVRNKSDQELLDDYFRFRQEFLAAHPQVLRPEAEGFLRRLARTGVTAVCYGGLAEDHMRRELGALGEVFDRYVCTNDFRPGVKEIVEMYGIRPAQALFIDDVYYVAEHARELGAEFVGVPSVEPWSWQRSDMRAGGVPYIVSSVAEISDAMLEDIDARAASGRFWAQTVPG